MIQIRSLAGSLDAMSRPCREGSDAQAPQRAVAHEDQTEQQERRRLVLRIGAHELRQEGEEEQRHFRVEDVGQRALQEHPSQRYGATFCVGNACLRSRQQHHHTYEAKISRAGPFHDGKGRRGGGEQRRKADRAAGNMDEAAGADSERRSHATPPSQLHAARGDVGGIGSGRHVEQKPGGNEQPQIVDAEHSNLSLRKTTS